MILKNLMLVIKTQNHEIKVDTRKVGLLQFIQKILKR